jgi:hypothetical protein
VHRSDAKRSARDETSDQTDTPTQARGIEHEAYPFPYPDQRQNPPARSLVHGSCH